MKPTTAVDGVGVSCGGCGGSTLMRLWSSLDYLTSDHFDVLECTRCGLRQTHPQPAAESMVGYYGNSYYGKKGRRFVGLLERLERWFRESRSRFIVGLHPDPGTVLDVGCGRGAMLAALAERGWKRSGTELASGEATSSVGQDVELFFKELLDCHFPDGHFDVVTLWHVLEHLRDPVGTIGEIGRTLAPDGLLVLEVRNVFRWQSAMGRGRLLHLDVPRHLFHFSLPWLQERLEAAGFTPVHTGTFPWSRGPLVWCRPS